MVLPVALGWLVAQKIYQISEREREIAAHVLMVASWVGASILTPGNRVEIPGGICRYMLWWVEGRRIGGICGRRYFCYSNTVPLWLVAQSLEFRLTTRCALHFIFASACYLQMCVNFSINLTLVHRFSASRQNSNQNIQQFEIPD